MKMKLLVILFVLKLYAQVNIFNVKSDFYEILTSCQAKINARVKLLRNSCLIFQVFRSSFLSWYLRKVYDIYDKFIKYYAWLQFDG